MLPGVILFADLLAETAYGQAPPQEGDFSSQSTCLLGCPVSEYGEAYEDDKMHHCVDHFVLDGFRKQPHAGQAPLPAHKAVIHVRGPASPWRIGLTLEEEIRNDRQP